MKKLLYTLFAVSIIFASCKKVENEIITPTLVNGCKDTSATNYNVYATNDDGSCIYIISGCTDSIATNYNILVNVDDGSCTYSIVGIWQPNSISVNSNYTVSILGQNIQSFDTSYTMTPEEAGIEGNIQFTSDGNVITTNDDGNTETDTYTTSGDTVTVVSIDDSGYSEIQIGTFTVTNTTLSFTISESDSSTDDGMLIENSYDMTYNCTRQ
tara:strand:- start:134 stop:769 length:636 start_codon:yes stop_codon:yes gene_type:complete